VRFNKQESTDLLGDFDLDAPHVTEVRRLLQHLARQQERSHVECRSYLFTSAGREEGKSTTCAMMAIVSARVFHKRTLLIDGDLRRPTVHSLLRVAQSPGLFEYLQGSAGLSDVTHPTALPLLSVIPRGHLAGAIGDAYSDEGFRRLIEQSRGSYDQIFVDAPPVVPVIEPLLMAEHVDSILIIAMAGRTPLTAVRRSMQILAPVASKIAGVVLNNAVDGLPYYYDYRYYGYKEVKPLLTDHADSSERPVPNAPGRPRDTGGKP
jgi:capsular exopolysaccharide synthesis family protein